MTVEQVENLPPARIVMSATTWLEPQTAAAE
jgi:hypothetical protein